MMESPRAVAHNVQPFYAIYACYITRTAFTPYGK